MGELKKEEGDINFMKDLDPFQVGDMIRLNMEQKINVPEMFQECSQIFFTVVDIQSHSLFGVLANLVKISPSIKGYPVKFWDCSRFKMADEVEGLMNKMGY